MASPALRLVGGRDFRPCQRPQQVLPGATKAGGWPFTPELLAALQNADPKTLKRAQTAVMIALDWDMAPTEPL
ncbi:hypothetical protein ABIC83_001778 [Roseateles asaccharophilus]|uniref:Uncharacterized protein n=1 Tax=Roseateles asaccharophilus TaxID=582607 RepID=A0ABU2A460_9BURK|nr:hypothetical protein [Roseateles asaccharophilus]